MAKFKIHIALSHDDEGSFYTFCGITSDNASEQFFDDAKIVDKHNHVDADCKTCIKAINAWLKYWAKKAEKIESLIDNHNK